MGFRFPAPALELTDLVKLVHVWPDYATFQADLSTEFSSSPLFDFAEMDANYFWLWFWKGLEDAFNDAYTNYTTEAKFKLHFYGTIVSEAPYFYKAWQLYQREFDANRPIQDFFHTGSEETTRAKDETIARTGTDSTFTKAAETPTDLVPATAFVDDYTTAQNASTLTRNTTDTVNDDETTTKTMDAGVAEIFQRFNSIKSSELDRLIQAFAKHFVSVFVDDFADE